MWKAVRHLLAITWIGIGYSLVPLTSWAALAEKPSVYRPHVPDTRLAHESSHLVALRSRHDFDLVARTYDAGTPMAIPHVLFALDRHLKTPAGTPQMYYINSRRYPFHEDFIAAQHNGVALSRAELNRNYLADNRRYVFGMVSWRQPLQKWVWEAWEGDPLSKKLVQLTQQRLTATFFAPVVFKSNSSVQEAVARSAGIALITQEDLVKALPFIPLNIGHTTGRLRLIDQLDTTTDIQASDILVLQEVPLTLPPIAGLITTRPSTVLSHANLLAKSWAIPNAYIRAAIKELQALNGQWVDFTVTRTTYQIQASAAPPPKAAAATSTLAIPHQAMPPRPATRLDLVPLAQLRARDAQDCGGKAANLGELSWALQAASKHTHIAQVPDGFCIPFSHYNEFMQQPQVQAHIQEAERSPGFDTDPAQRQRALKALQQDLLQMPIAPQRAQAWLTTWQNQLGAKGVFVRSSSNAEDLPHMNGAGLYTSVPNVIKEADLLIAIKTVWASVFNYPAYEVRRLNHIPLTRTSMAVFVQQAVPAHSSGVMVTCDPFDPTHHDTAYISAKKGLGIKVVEGRDLAEQVLYNGQSRIIQYLSRSEDTSELQLDAQGGTKEKAIEPQQRVLNDALIRRLAKVGFFLRQLFQNQEQDIEWATDEQEHILILQSRPFVQSSARH